MKYMELPELSMLSRMLTHNSNECTVHTRLEAYSCKAITKDKKMLRHLEHNYHIEEKELASSPPYLTHEREPEITVFGPMDSYSSRKTLYLLIGTLNHAFPDHDFSELRPDNFSREESGASILNALSTTLVSLSTDNSVAGSPSARTYSAYPPANPNLFSTSLPTSSSPINRVMSPFTRPQIVSGTHPTLYRLLDDIIKLDESELYTYTPDVQSDPHSTDSDVEDDAWDSDETSSVASPVDIDKIRGDAALKIATPSFLKSTLTNDSDTSPDSLSASPTRARPRNFTRKRNGGGLLWSTHSFFYNRRLKRIMYVTTWARKKTGGNLMTSSQQLERFTAWEGGVGAGARAFGLNSGRHRRASTSSI